MVVVVVVLPSWGSITAISVIAVAVSSIAALVVQVLLQVDIPAGSLLLGDAVLHDSAVCWKLGTDPAPTRPSFITKLVPSLIDPARSGGEGRAT